MCLYKIYFIPIVYYTANFLEYQFPPRGFPKLFSCVIARTFQKNKNRLLAKAAFLLVPVAGVEPARYRYHRILSPARLPIPPHRRRLYQYNIAQKKNQVVLKKSFKQAKEKRFLLCLFLSPILQHAPLTLQAPLDFLHYFAHFHIKRAANSVERFKSRLPFAALYRAQVRSAYIRKSAENLLRKPTPLSEMGNRFPNGDRIQIFSCQIPHLENIVPPLFRFFEYIC